MMMQGRHDEKSLSSQFEAQHLQNHREGFDDENATDDHQKQFLLTTNGDHAQHTADRQRSGVSHENFSWITVEPEKTESRSNECRADNRQFPGKRIERDLQVFRDAEIPSRVRKQ